MTYQEAKKLANKSNPNVVYIVKQESGSSEVYYCPMRNRQIWTTVTQDGIRIV